MTEYLKELDKLQGKINYAYLKGREDACKGSDPLIEILRERIELLKEQIEYYKGRSS